MCNARYNPNVCASRRSKVFQRGGVRWFLSNNTQADLAVAVPLSYRAPDNPARDVRVLFSLTSALELCSTKASTRCL
jgi:hypothetical protein